MRSYSLLMIAILLLAGCGYQVVGRQNRSGVSQMAIPIFVNGTTAAGIENTLTAAVREEFIKSKRISIVSTDKAEAVLRGSVTYFTETPVSFTKEGFAFESRATVVIDVQLVRSSDGAVIWKAQSLAYSDEYFADNDVPTNERRKSQTIRRISAELAQQISHGILSGF